MARETQVLVRVQANGGEFLGPEIGRPALKRWLAVTADSPTAGLRATLRLEAPTLVEISARVSRIDGGLVAEKNYHSNPPVPSAIETLSVCPDRMTIASRST